MNGVVGCFKVGFKDLGVVVIFINQVDGIVFSNCFECCFIDGGQGSGVFVGFNGFYNLIGSDFIRYYVVGQ